MIEFPLDPVLAKVLIASIKFGCSDEILTIVSLLSSSAPRGLFYRPRVSIQSTTSYFLLYKILFKGKKQALADERKARFNQQEGDHCTLLTVYNEWKENGYSDSWCRDNFISSKSIREAKVNIFYFYVNNNLTILIPSSKEKK